MCFFSIPYNVANSTATTSCGDKLYAFEQKVFLAKPERDQNNNQNKAANPNPHLEIILRSKEKGGYCGCFAFTLKSGHP